MHDAKLLSRNTQESEKLTQKGGDGVHFISN